MRILKKKKKQLIIMMMKIVILIYFLNTRVDRNQNKKCANILTRYVYIYYVDCGIIYG